MQLIIRHEVFGPGDRYREILGPALIDSQNMLG